MMGNMIAAIVALAVSSMLAAGILLKQKRILTLLASAGTIWEAQWLGLTLVGRVVWPQVNPEVIFLAGSLVSIVPWLIKIRQWTWPYREPGSGRRDLAVLIMIGGVLGAASLVQAQNGFQNTTWVTHGFYNGDTMTMISLVQRSLLEPGLVQENPFAANKYLEYPTLWHGGLATLLTAFNVSMDWIHFLASITYTQILLTVPIFFLFMDTVMPEPDRKEVKWLGVRSRIAVLLVQTLIIGYVLAVSWDSYIYPQTHFFITGMWLLGLALLVRADEEKGNRQLWWTVPAGIITLVVLLSNAVTGAAAVAVTIAYYGKKSIAAKQKMQARAIWLAGIIGWVIAFAMWSAGDVMVGWPNFSYTAAESMMRLAPVVIVLGLVMLKQPAKKNWLSLAMVVLMGMAALMFFLSKRNIIVANSERFIYHALLVGYPLLLAPSISLYYAWKRLWYEDNDLAGWISRFGSTAAISLIFIFPALISGARTHDHLMRQDEQKVNLGEQEALEYIKQNTAADDVILADSQAPWMVPMFTGRSQVRADFWLAPADAVLEEVKQAFKGNMEAQAKSLQRAQYLLIRQDEIVKWELDRYEKVFHNGQMAIYKTSTATDREAGSGG